ncbi:MAG TPA: hypothetical protein VF221_00635 [Chloroflexota bacterium]
MMPSDHLKTLIRRLFESESQLHAFLSSPERMLADVPISPQERRAVLRLRGELAASGGGAGSARFDTITWP